ncbi:VanW like protein [Corynebacterium massiliense DSM 45435]|uniref:VanW like protein n=1 Tax=Corynebacterium massiliense DSM 45435 TaxID=1121364 RepID=A0ABY7U9G4_9CORY|nr:VanW like protein [Corynebacterium massiliense DSM 45435]
MNNQRIGHSAHADHADGGQKSRGARGWAITLGILVGLFVIAGVAYAIDVVSNQGKVPRSVSVGGVDISNMERHAAVQKLKKELGGVEDNPVTVKAGDQHAEFIPAEAGLSMDYQAAVDSIDDASLNPIARVYSFFRPMEERSIDTQVDEDALGPQLERLHDELTVEPKNATLELDGAEIKKTPEVIGQSIDDAELNTKVREDWLDPDGVEVAAEEQKPAIGNKAVDELADGDLKRALDGPLKLKGRDDVTAEISPEHIADIVSIREDPEKHSLALDVDAEAAQGIFAETLSSTEKPKRNADIDFSGGKKRVIPHSDGVSLDWENTMDGFPDRVTGSKGREWDAAYTDDPATFTTEDAERASFDDTLGEFTTSGFSKDSGRNIQLVADKVNGAIVAPGDTFSLNGYTGPRGEAQGYVKSGIIIDGHAGEAVGGGISQFATTLYNAEYFAGMGDVAHTPHSYYINRYPAGREATVYEGAIDLAFKNTSKYPVRIETSYTDNDITVRLKGVKTVDVESVNNGRWAQTQPTEMKVPGDECSPSNGNPGFTTSDTRIIRDLKGNELDRQTTTTVYDPQPIVKCS